MQNIVELYRLQEAVNKRNDLRLEVAAKLFEAKILAESAQDAEALAKRLEVGI